MKKLSHRRFLRIAIPVSALLLATALMSQAADRVVKNLVSQGNSLYQQRDYAGAKDQYIQAITNDATYAMAFSDLGLACARLGEANAAVSNAQRAVQLETTNAVFLLNLGKVQAMNEQFGDAITSFTSALATNSAYKEALYNRAWCQDALGNFSAAIADYQQAINLDPSYAKALQGLAITKAKAGQTNEAVWWCKRAIQVSGGAGNSTLINALARQNLWTLRSADVTFEQTNSISTFVSALSALVRDRAIDATNGFAQLVQAETNSALAHYMNARALASVNPNSSGTSNEYRTAISLLPAATFASIPSNQPVFLDFYTNRVTTVTNRLFPAGYDVIVKSPPFFAMEFATVLDGITNSRSYDLPSTISLNIGGLVYSGAVSNRLAPTQSFQIHLPSLLRALELTEFSLLTPSESYPFNVDIRNATGFYGGQDAWFSATLASGSPNVTLTKSFASSTNGDQFFQFATASSVPDLETASTFFVNWAIPYASGSFILRIAAPDLAVTQVSGPASAVTGTYLSLTNTVSNLGTASLDLFGNGLVSVRFYLSSSPLGTGNNILLGERTLSYTNSSLQPAGNSTEATLLFLSNNIAAGTYYLRADVSYLSAPETTMTNNTLMGNVVVIGIGPDLMVSSIVPGPDVVAGRPMTVKWTVTNAGNGAAAVAWNDRLYLSTNATWESSDYTLGALAHSVSLDAGSSYTASGALTLPEWPDGTYYLIVRADADGNLPEAVETNNTLAVPVTITRPDLVPVSMAGVNMTSVTLSNRVICPGPYPQSAHNYANYTDRSWTNRYPGADWLIVTFDGRTSGEGCCDYVQIMDGAGNPIAGSPFLLGALTGQTKVVLGDTVRLRFTSDISGIGWGFAVTSIEGGQLASTPPIPSATPRDRIWASWTVNNQGNGAALPSWPDRVYFSTNADWDAQDTMLAGVTVANAVAVGSNYTQGAYVSVPNVAEGDYYLLVKADADAGLPESNETNNVLAMPVRVRLPDLVPTNLVVTGDAVAGRSLTVSWAVANQGNGPLVAGTAWNDKVYVSSNSVWTTNATLLGTFSVNQTLATGAGYALTNTVTLPSLPTGNFFLLVLSDADGTVWESNETNNVLALSMSVLLSDLAPTNLVVSGSVAAGRPLTMSWTVANQGNGPLTAGTAWNDKIYVSSNSVWTTNAVLVGSFSVNQIVPVGGAYTLTNTVTLPAWPPGNYFVMVWADADGAVPESVEANNVLVVPLAITQPDLVPVSMAGVNMTSVTLSNRVICPGPYPQSAHNYANYTDRSWTNRYPGADWLIVTFDGRTSGEGCCDYVQIMDGAGNPIAGSPFLLGALTGQTKVVLGDTVRLRFTSDISGIGWGFAVTSIEGGQLASTPPIPSATPRDRIWASWTVNNQGNGAALPSWPDRVYFSTNADWDAQDTILAGVTVANAVAVGSNYTQGAYVSVPNVAEGDYYLLVKADADAGLPESNETNNVLAMPVRVRLPDLVPTNLVVTGDAVAGRSLTVSWAVANQGNGPLVAGTAWNDKVYVSSNSVWTTNATLLGTFSVNQTLATGAGYALTNTVTLPSLPTGNFFLLVLSDADGTVWESNETNNVLALSMSVLLSDLAPTNLVVSGSVAAGRPLTMSWTVANQGNGPLTAGTAWNDKIYVSSNSVWTTNAVLVGSFSVNQIVPVGGAYTLTNTVTLPAWPPGNYFVMVWADADGAVPESVEANNVLVVPLAITQPDLVPVSMAGVNMTSVTLSNRVICPGPYPQSAHNYANYTDRSWTNRYPGADWLIVTFDGRTSGEGCCDYVQIMDGAGNPIAGSPFLLGALTGQTKVVLGDTVRLRFTSDISGIGWGFAVTSIEGGQLASTPPIPSATPRDRIWASWTVNNQGNGAALPSWPDRVYFSTNADWDAQDTILAGVTVANAVAVGSNYTQGAYVSVPNVAEGDYYLLVKADADAGLPESNETNNVLAMPVRVRLPDLVPTNLVVTGDAVAGRSLTVSWAVANQGNGPLVAGTAWNDKVYVSSNSVWTTNATLLGTFSVNQTLATGAGYALTNTVTLPSLPTGNFFLLVLSDADGTVWESNETNNVLALSMSVLLSDLAPTNLVVSGSVAAGRPLTMSWTVANQGNGPLTAGTAWNDKIYVSSNSVWTTNAVLVGSFSVNQIVPVGGAYTLTNTVTLPAWPPGNYFVMVWADADGAVPESVEANNVLVVPLAITQPDLVPVSMAGVNMTSVTLSNRVICPGPYPQSAHNYANYTDRSWTNRYPGADWLIVTFDGRTSGEGCCDYVQIMDGAGNPIAGSPFLLGALTGQTKVVLGDTVRLRFTSDISGIGWGFAVTSIEGGQLASTPPIPSATPRDRIWASWTVNNQGNGAALPSWPDRVYFSTNADWDAQDTILAGVTVANAVAVGSNYTQGAYVSVPNVAEGDYYLLVKADADAGLPESNETNNVLAMPVRVRLPDLVPTNLVVTGDAVAGRSLTVSWAVANQGNGPLVAGTAWNDKVYVSSNSVWTTNATLLGTFSVNQTLATGAAYMLTNTVTMPAGYSSNCYFIVKVDDQNTVYEANELNNWRTLGVGDYLDVDRDGIPDAWEIRYFGSTANCDPNADPDGDGMSNLAEYLAGTDPTQRDEVLAIVQASVTNRTPFVFWSAKSNKTYQVLKSLELLSWSNAPSGAAPNEQSLRTAVANGFLQYSDPVSSTNGSRKSFYRVKLVQ